jgi:hypothetical protein
MDQSNTSLTHRKGRYTSGGTTEVSGRFMEWWERRTYVRDQTDTIYTVERRFEGRLDQLSAIFLGDSRHWWLIAMYNNLLDPTTEVVEGRVLFIPSPERANELLDGRAGGVPSTRTIPPAILPIV